MLANRVREITMTTGTGAVTLSGALAGHIRFADAFGAGDAVAYVIEDGDNYEIGTGMLSGEDTLVRAAVAETLVDGVHDTDAPAAISLSGNALVFCAVTAEFLLDPVVKANSVVEKTPDAGVTVDGALIKDGGAVFSGSVSAPEIHGSNNAGALDIFGGADTSGANIALYGATHATRAGDTVLRAGATPWLEWDSSAQGMTVSGDFFATGDVGIGVTPDEALHIGRDNGDATLLLQRTNAHITGNGFGDIEWRNSADAVVVRVIANAGTADADAADMTFTVSNNNGDLVSPLILRGSTGIAEVSGGLTVAGRIIAENYITRSINDDVLIVSGGDGASSGGNILFYGGDHSFAAGDTSFRSGSASWLYWDSSLSTATLAGSIDMGTNTITPRILKFRADRTSENLSLGSIEGYWDGTRVAQIDIQTGDDTANKDNGQIVFYTAPEGSIVECGRFHESGLLQLLNGLNVAGGIKIGGASDSYPIAIKSSGSAATAFALENDENTNVIARISSGPTRGGQIKLNNASGAQNIFLNGETGDLELVGDITTAGTVAMGDLNVGGAFSLSSPSELTIACPSSEHLRQVISIDQEDWSQVCVSV